MKRLITLLLALSFSAIGFATAGPAGIVLAMATPATDIEAIAKWAGLYDRNMIAQVLNGLDVFSDLSVDRNVSRQGKLLPKFVAEAGMRPLDTFVETNGRKERSIGGRKLFVYDCMKLFKIVPEEARESFLSDLIAPGAPDLPFAQWFWMREMEKLGSEINDNFYQSEYHADADAWASGDTYSTGDFVKFTDDNYYKAIDNTTAGQSPTTHPAKWEEVNGTVCFDGPAKIIADLVTASATNVVTTGAITSSNALEKIEDMYKDMTPAHKKRGGVFWLPTTVFENYMLNKRSVYSGTATEDIGDGRQYVYGSRKRWEIKEASWIIGSNRVIIDINLRNQRNSNLTVGSSFAGDRAPQIGKIVPTVHGYLTSAKWLMGFQIADAESLYVNDQA